MATPQTSPQTLTGAMALFKINNLTVAVSNCSYTWTHNNQPIEILGNETVVEHAPLGVTVELTCDTFRLQSTVLTGVGVGIMPTISGMLAANTLEASIVNKDSASTVLIQVGGIKLKSRTGTVGARGVWTETLTFDAQVISDNADAGTASENSTSWPTGA